MSNPLVYNADTIADPIVRDLTRQIELMPLEEASHDAPGAWPAEILIECAGQHHTLRTGPHKGSPANVFTWSEASEKFTRYTASLLNTPHATAIIGAVAGLEKVGAMDEVARTMRAPA